jgi:hypothetical protein
MTKTQNPIKTQWPMTNGKDFELLNPVWDLGLGHRVIDWVLGLGHGSFPP